MIQRGIATFTLDEGKCPRWLFERMVKLGRSLIRAIVADEGPNEFIRRIGDPVWFQSLGTVLAFDWNASGLTTVLTAALKEAVRGQEKDLGIFICGGKGKTSRKTPDEINSWGEKLNLNHNQTKALVYNSKMSAKVDSALVQDGFQIYHHSFFFSNPPAGSGVWTVVQQGMNTGNLTARRYHWFSPVNLIEEPHSGIISDTKALTLNLTAQESSKTRALSTELVHQNYLNLMKDIKLLDKYSSNLSRMARYRINENQLTLLKLEDEEFNYHPVIFEDFYQSPYLQKILWKLCDERPESYETLLGRQGVGPKTIRALALVAELIYGAKPSYEDPARYSFAHGGKDNIPYPINRGVYDQTIEIIKKYVQKGVKKSYVT